MTADPTRIDEIFAAALAETSSGARAAYVDQACRDNPELRERLEALLAAHDAAGRFMHLSGGAATAPFTPLSERPGTTIGPYKLLEQIGEGGMGVVFMADQERPVRRRVALKVIKPGMDTRQVIARFEAERQALALMDHANIAKVFDAGATDAGRPYFVMELVRGVPITEYCDQHNLPVHERLELFVLVCHAVQHAHQKGIIHRDLKPSNVLVALDDGRGVPKVIDFGVAKATGQQLTEKTLFTAFAQMVGTPLYMSPEQAQMTSLDVDTRSDIYSLGVLLYELLTGTTPFDQQRMRSAAFDEIRRIIRDEEPPKPSTRISSMGEARTATAAHRQVDARRLGHLVQGDLDWIVMKSLEKDRARRYDTAGDFAADVLRHLSDQPVEACPPSALYRFRKFARRNKPALLTAALVGTALILGIVVCTRQAIRATRAEAQALAGAQEARQSEAQTRAVLDFVKNKIFAAARPKGQNGGLGHDVTLRRAVEAALPSVETSFTDQPLIEAQLRQTLGLSFWYLGEAGKAAEQFQKARRSNSEHLGPDHPDTLQNMHDLAVSYADLGRIAEALKLREETLARRKATLGPDHLGTLASMANLANSYSALGRYADALKLTAETLALYKTKLGPDHPDTLMSMGNLAASYARLGRYAEALRLHEEVLALRKAKLGADHPDTLSSMRNLAANYGDLGRHAEALKLQEETFALQKTILGPGHPETFASIEGLAQSYNLLGRYADGLKFFEEALALYKAKLGPDHPGTLGCMNGLANCYSALDRHADAFKLQEETLVQTKAKFGPDHPHTLLSMNNLAICYNRLGRHADALKLFDETLALQQAKLGPDHPDTLLSMHNMAESIFRLGRHADALKLIDEVVVLRKAKLGPNHPQTLTSMHGLANCYAALGRTAEALKLHEETLALVRTELAPGHPNTLSSMNGLATRYTALGRHADALKLYEETLALQKAKLGPDHPDTLTSMNNLANSYTALGRHADALKLNEETIALRKAKFGLDHPDTLLSMNNLARSYAALGRHAEALKLHEETLALMRTKLGADHPHTLVGINGLANCYTALGRHADALKLNEEALALMKTELGPDHPDTLAVMNNSAISYSALGRTAEALKLREETLSLRKAKLGPDHPDTLLNMYHVALSYSTLGRHSEALKLVEEVLLLRNAKLGPDHLDTLWSRNELAWALATCGDPAMRNPGRALELAKNVVERAPEEGAFWNTLGVAHYRAGDWKAAIAALETSMKLRAGGKTSDWFFLAMAHWQRGDREEAGKWRRQAAEWMEKNNPDIEELRRFRDEAAELLGISPSPPATDAATQP